MSELTSLNLAACVHFRRLRKSLSQHIQSSIFFNEFRPCRDKPAMVASVLAIVGNQWYYIPIVVDIDELSGDKQMIFDLLDTRLRDAIAELLNMVIPEDPFVTWAKEVIESAKRSEVEENNL